MNPNKASQYIRRAQELSHPVSGLLPRVLSVTAPGMPSESMPTFTQSICHYLKSERTFKSDAKILVTSGSPLLRSGTQFSSYLEYQQRTTPYEIRKYIGQHRMQILPVPTVMNHLEIAMTYDDEESVHALASYQELLEGSAFGDPPLVQAFRKGNYAMVKSLIDHGAEVGSVSKDGSNVLHWLFLLEDKIDAVCKLLRGGLNMHSIQKCFASSRLLHTQWPVQLAGSPLSFAVTVGCLKAVKALLGLGASPVARSFALDSDDDESNIPPLTPINLAVKYHMSEILRVLIAKVYRLSGPWTNRAEQITKIFNQRTFFQELNLPRTLSYSSIIERYAIHDIKHVREVEKTIEVIPFQLIELPCPNGQTALMQAIDCNDLSIVTALLKRYPELGSQPFEDPSAKGCYTFLLHFAAQVGSERDAEDAISTIEYLLNFHINGLYAKDDLRRTPLHLAVTGNSARITQWILESYKKDGLNEIDHLGRTPLHIAGSLANTIALLDVGANIDIIDKHGLTATHLAALTGSEVRAKELVLRGARLSSNNNKYGTPLHCAVLKVSRPIVQILGLKELIDIQNVYGLTALHLAIRVERLDLVQLLLEKQANVLLMDQDGYSSLDVALSCERPAIVEAIVSSLPDSAHLNGIFVAALHVACSHGKVDSIGRFLAICQKRRYPVDVNTVHDGRTALHVVAKSVQVDLARVLLKFGADVNARNKAGCTPLLIACNSNQRGDLRDHDDRAGFCSILHKHGASLSNSTRSSKYSPWTLANDYRDWALMDFLLQNKEEIDEWPDEIRVHQNVFEEAVKARAWGFIKTCLQTRTINFCPVFRDFVDYELAINSAMRGDLDMMSYIIIRKHTRSSMYYSTDRQARFEDDYLDARKEKHKDLRFQNSIPKSLLATFINK